MHNQLKGRSVIVRIIRLLAGVLITTAFLQLSDAQASRTWLVFPYSWLVVTSMLSAWVTGPPWGWVVTAGCIMLLGAFDIARAIQGPLAWYYRGDLVAAVLSQGETLQLTGFFALLTSAGGLCAWGSNNLLKHLFQRGRQWLMRTPG